MNGATPTPSPPDDRHGPGSLPEPEPTPSPVPDSPHPVEPSPSPLPEPTPDPAPSPLPEPTPSPLPDTSPVPGPEPVPDPEPGGPPPDPGTDPDPQPLSPPDPIDPPEPEPEPFADGPPPLPKPMLVLDGELPEHAPGAAPPEPVDHGTCPACGGAYDEDGWCTQCGERKADPGHHVTAQPAPHVAAVCDRGRRHTSNEDAMAIWADADDPTTAALVVCDGVSSASRSAEASRAAADAALQVLLDFQLTEPERIVAATDAAAAAVEALAAEHPGDSPSCTYVAGLLVGGRITVGSVGDSRAYWLPDEGTPVRLTTDDSMAEEHVRAGVSRAEAEAGPMAHTITRWLGSDAPDHTPHLTEQDASVPGWMVLCTDGLWNYASEAEDLHAVVRAEQERVGSDPLELAEALVAWANARGGVDNITVALARAGDARQDGVHG